MGRIVDVKLATCKFRRALDGERPKKLFGSVWEVEIRIFRALVGHFNTSTPAAQIIAARWSASSIAQTPPFG
jgi:hypothetical protein